MRRTTITICLIAMLSAFALADEPKTQFMSPEEVRPGMKGYGLTVFQGTKPERFEVEILGVVEGMVNPRESIVMARLTGPHAGGAGVFQGMSGSPIYVDGKLLGALAYGFGFSKEPIFGITPIKYMVKVFEQGVKDEQRSSQRLSFNTLLGSASTTAQSPSATTGQISTRSATGAAASYLGQTIMPILTPVSFSGIPQSVIDVFADELKRAGIQPVAGVGGSSSLSPMVPADENTLTGGSSVSAQLVRGDFAIAAAGTVTYRDGDKIYAFGHPFLSSGQTSWPMIASSVVTVVPSLNASFKLSGDGPFVGAISQDRSNGVFGRLGEKPRLIPVRMTVHTSRNKTESYNFEIVSDPFLTPLLVKMAMFSAISATERSIGHQTIKLSGRISLDGQPDVVLDNSFSLPNGAFLYAVMSIERPLAALLNSGFDTLNLQKIEVDVTSLDARSSGMLSRLWVDKTEVRRGESIEIQAFARNDNGAEFVERIPIQIPSDAPSGPLVIMIGDGASMNQAEKAVQPTADFVPKDLNQLVRAINKLKRNNRLYVKVLRSGTGAIVHNEEMPTLPPSVLATLGSQRTSGGYTPLSVATLSEAELPPSRFVISGQQTITINVID
jgi:hypothetical protein